MPDQTNRQNLWTTLKKDGFASGHPREFQSVRAASLA